MICLDLKTYTKFEVDYRLIFLPSLDKANSSYEKLRRIK